MEFATGNYTQEEWLEFTQGINKWQRDTFGDYTTEQQMLKVSEELIEYAVTLDDEDKICELVDVFISACGLLDTSFIETAEFIAKFCIIEVERYYLQIDDFIDEIERKMQINRSRTWIKGENGVYKHQEV